MSARTRVRIILIAAVLLGLFLIIFYPDKIETEGNAHVKDAEIRSLLAEDPLAFNSALLCLRARLHPFRPGGYIESVDLSMKNPRCIIAHVTEKKMAGYFASGSAYWYFDSAGIVQAASPYTEEELTGTRNVPLIEGIDISGVTIGESLPGAGTGIFGKIGSLASVLAAEGLSADSLEIAGGRVTAWYGDVGVLLGDLSDLDIRIARMRAILPQTEGMSGYLHLEGYDGTADGVIFEKADTGKGGTAVPEDAETPAEGEAEITPEPETEDEENEDSAAVIAPDAPAEEPGAEDAGAEPDPASSVTSHGGNAAVPGEAETPAFSQNNP